MSVLVSPLQPRRQSEVLSAHSSITILPSSPGSHISPSSVVLPRGGECLVGKLKPLCLGGVIVLVLKMTITHSPVCFPFLRGLSLSLPPPPTVRGSALLSRLLL